MIISRLSIVLVLLGSALLFFRPTNYFPTLPFPPAGRSVNGMVSAGSSGNYYVVVRMTKIDDSIGLKEESVPCLLRVTITGRDDGDGHQPREMEIQWLQRYSEFGFGKTQDYRGAKVFPLRRGDYKIAVEALGPCVAAASRGATFSLEEDVGDPTAAFLKNILFSWIGRGALCFGLPGLVVGEFITPKSPPKPMRTCRSY